MSEENLFPLLLTNFEAALLADDRPAYPMTVFYQLRFNGFLELPAFQAALETVIRRHPLLRARIDRNWLGQLVWKLHPNWQPKILQQAKLTPGGLPHMTYLDPRKEAGFRVWILERDDGHDVVMQIHHCSTDGAGGNTIIEDLLVSYALNQGAQNSVGRLRLLDARQLLRRGAPKLTFGNFLMIGLKQLRGLAGVREFLGRSPVPLMGQYSTVSLSSTTHDSFPAILSHEFNANESEKIINAAKSSGVTITTLLLRDLFLTIGAWRQKLQGSENQDWIRIMLPVNLRSANNHAMPTANAVSLLFPERQALDFDDKDRLLKSLHEQLSLIKRFHLEYTYILSLGAARLVPGLMQLMTRFSKCQTTTYLSSLGAMLDQAPLPRQDGQIVCGNAVLESMHLASVLRPHTNAGFLVYSYAGRLKITLQYDPRAVQPKQAEDLLAAYVWQIGQTVTNNNKGQ